MGQLSIKIIPVGLFQTNCTVLFDKETKEGVLVDPGDEASRILQTIKSDQIHISALWLTHGHIDHVQAAMEIKRTLNIPLLGPHKADEPMLTNLNHQAQLLGLSGYFNPCLVDRFFEDGETISFGSHIFRILHCPGHTNGHVIYYNAESSFVQTGDVLFHGSIGRTDLPGGNYAMLIDSIHKKLLPLGDDVRFVCGHGPGGLLGDERRKNPFLQKDRQEA